MHNQLLFAKRTILCFGVMLLSLGAGAKTYSSRFSSGISHYLDLGLGGGVAIPVTKSERLSNQIGADAQVTLSYELNKSNFLFGIGAGVQYDLWRRSLDPFVESSPSMDPNMNPMDYRHVFNTFAEQQHELMLTIPVQFGYYITEHFYAAIGAKVQLPFYSAYTSTANIHTEGSYVNLSEYISRNVPSFGYYPEADYTASGNSTIQMGSDVRVAPGIELGGRFQLAGRLSCKVALYAEYAIPVLYAQTKYDLVDFSRVNTQPGTRTQQNLQDNIGFNPITTSRYNATVIDMGGQQVAKTAQSVSVGVRFVFHLNVSTSPKICVCLPD